MSFCQIESCEAKHYSKGYCRPHYYRWSKWGDPLITGQSGQPRKYHTEEERKAAARRRNRKYNAGRGQAYHHEYWQANKERHNMHGRISKHKRRAMIEITDMQAVKEYSQILLGDPCCICGDPSEHLDHIVPISQGGSGDWDNLTAMCAPCNLSKNASSLLVWMAS